MDATSRLCPVCSVPMLELEVRGVEIDRCDTSQGVFFDCAELSHLGERPLVPTLGEGVALACPDCSSLLRSASLCDRFGVNHALAGCECCEGLWLSGPTVQALVGELRGRAPREPSLDRCSSCGSAFGGLPVPTRQGLLCQACSADIVEPVSGPLLPWHTRDSIARDGMSVALALLEIFIR